ncbi:spore coat associated protein CotJA [Clostridium sp. AM58-1XD]|nr:spore coat associated protein CotJA [Clostridium sp. AM58-1XD]
MFRNASSGMTVGVQSCCCTQPNMQPGPRSNMQTCPSSNVQTGPQPNMRTIPQTNMQTAPQTNMQTTPQTNMQAAPQMDMQDRGQADMRMPMQSSMPTPSAQAGAYAPSGNINCPGSSIGPIESYTEIYPVGMGYVPMQQWRQTYNLEQGFSRGTIFPELDLPFIMGRCQ